MDRSILLVDADVNFRRALAIGLRLEGLGVVETGDPAEAGRLLASRGGFDLALLDLLLPWSPVLELLDRIRTRHPDTRPILTCSRPDLFAVVGLRAAGVERLEKPFPPEQLLSLLADRPPAAGYPAAAVLSRNGSGRPVPSR
jgi:DNA-binding NtrC family response regulator